MGSSYSVVEDRTTCESKRNVQSESSCKFLWCGVPKEAVTGGRMHPLEETGSRMQKTKAESISEELKGKYLKRILVLDNDETLYRKDWALDFSKNIRIYCKERCNLAEDECKNLYKKHGSTLQGLLKEGHIKESDVDEYLEFAHTFPKESKYLIQPDEKLRDFLEKVTAQIFVFTAGTWQHVKRCCQALGVSDILFPDSRPIIDVRTFNLIPKHNSKAFDICVHEIECFLKKLIDPKNIVFVDDSIKNIQCAKRSGWGTCVLLGAKDRQGNLRTTELEGVDYIVEHMSELKSIKELEDLFN